MDCLEAECYLQFLSYILVGNRSGLRIQGLLIRDNILNDIFQGVVLAAPQRVQVCLCVCVCYIRPCILLALF